MKRLIVLGLLLTGSACGPSVSGAGNPGSPQAADNVVQLNVTNHYNGPVTIYAVAAGTAYRMGIVLPGLSSHFILRQVQIEGGPVEFLAQLSGREPPVRSDRLLLAPGKIVDFEIATNLMNSAAIIRP